MAFCEKCGQQISSDAKFCRNCGLPVGAPASSLSNSGSPVPSQAVSRGSQGVQRPRKSRRWLLWIGGFFALVLVVVVVAANSGSSRSSSGSGYASDGSAEAAQAEEAARQRAEEAARLQAEEAARQRLERAISKDRSFIENDDNAKSILGFMHPTANYMGQRYSHYVPGDNGSFTIFYDFPWEDNNSTTVAFDADADGTVHSVSVAQDTSSFPAFVGANLLIQVLGNMVIDSYKDKMTDEQRNKAQQLVRDTDAKGLMELWLQLGTA